MKKKKKEKKAEKKKGKRLELIKDCIVDETAKMPKEELLELLEELKGFVEELENSAEAEAEEEETEVEVEEEE